MSVDAPTQEKPPTGRRRGRKTPDGPRATFGQLLPFIFEHKRTLVVVAVLSVLGALATLAQPLLVGQVITRVQLGETLGSLVWLLIALVVASSLLSGYQHYLLQRTGTGVVYSSRRKLIARILHLPISEFDARRTGDLVSRVGTDTTLLYAVLTQGLADAVGNALIFVGALVAMAVIDPILLALIVVVIGVSVIVVDAPPGGGPRLHRHPYEEVFVVQEGSATFTAGDDVIEATSGQVVVVPAGVAHKFVNSGAGRLRQVDIHASDHFVTEWLE